MVENFPSLWREIDILIPETQMAPNKLNQIVLKVKDKEFLKQIEKATHYIQENSHKEIGTFLNRNFSGQERMESYI